MRPLRRHVPRLGWLFLALLLAACARQLPLPAQPPQLELPMQLHVQRRSAEQTQDWLLVIQREEDALRWSLLDPLGIPLARQLLSDGRWKADGLLPPNAEARELFAALLFALSPAEGLGELYADSHWTADGDRSLKNGASDWRVRYGKNDRFDLDVGATLTYGVAPIATAGARH